MINIIIKVISLTTRILKQLRSHKGVAEKEWLWSTIQYMQNIICTVMPR